MAVFVSRIKEQYSKVLNRTLYTYVVYSYMYSVIRDLCCMQQTSASLI